MSHALLGGTAINEDSYVCRFLHHSDTVWHCYGATTQNQQLSYQYVREKSLPTYLVVQIN